MNESTWFKGYNEKFFYDKGVLFKIIYGCFAPIICMQFILRHYKKFCQDISPINSLKIMLRGAKLK